MTDTEQRKHSTCFVWPCGECMEKKQKPVETPNKEHAMDVLCLTSGIGVPAETLLALIEAKSRTALGEKE